MASIFRFKQFEVSDHQSTMRVGTDAILLGAWAQPPDHGHILDIGTGCGILALMMAQKSQAIITGIDIHAESVQQAAANFSQSPWAARLKVEKTGFTELAESQQEEFDYIISNPPFFINALKPLSLTKEMAKHTQPEFINEFAIAASYILKPHGKIAVILPTTVYNIVVSKLEAQGINPVRKAFVYSKPGSTITRVLLEAAKTTGENCIEESITIMDQSHSYTTSYLKLTKDFYLFRSD